MILTSIQAVAGMGQFSIYIVKTRLILSRAPQLKLHFAKTGLCKGYWPHLSHTPQPAVDRTLDNMSRWFPQTIQINIVKVNKYDCTMEGHESAKRGESKLDGVIDRPFDDRYCTITCTVCTGRSTPTGIFGAIHWSHDLPGGHLSGSGLMGTEDRTCISLHIWMYELFSCWPSEILL